MKTNILIFIFCFVYSFFHSQSIKIKDVEKLLSKDNKEISAYLLKNDWKFDEYNKVKNFTSFYYSNNSKESQEPISVIGFGTEKLKNPAIYYSTKDPKYFADFLKALNLKRPLNRVQKDSDVSVVFYKLGFSIVAIKIKKNTKKFELQIVSLEDYEDMIMKLN